MMGQGAWRIAQVTRCRGYYDMMNRVPDIATALEATFAPLLLFLKASVNFMEPLPEERAVHAGCGLAWPSKWM